MPGAPNLLWILTTQWRGQAAGYAGDRNARTPCLDALAARSVEFTAAMTPHPFGPFARAALLTGRPCPQNGVRDYFDPLPRTARTVAHGFSERGFSTAFIGKWHLSPRDPAAPLVGEAHARAVVAPEDRGGFGHWEGFESGFLLNDPYLHGTADPEPRRHPGYQSDVLADRALAWIASAREPWFCVVSLEPPHPPYAAAAAGEPPPPPGSLELRPNVPLGGGTEARARRELSGYYAHIAATDRALGRLLAGLPSTTRTVFTSVHGDMHGSHGLFRKGWPHEESVRVPLLIRDPALGRARIEEPVSLLDLERLSLDPLNPPAGPVQISMPSAVRLPDQCDRPWRGLRTRTRKLIWDATDRLWLHFDLAVDPNETNNLAPPSI